MTEWEQCRVVWFWTHQIKEGGVWGRKETIKCRVLLIASCSDWWCLFFGDNKTTFVLCCRKYPYPSYYHQGVNGTSQNKMLFNRRMMEILGYRIIPPSFIWRYESKIRQHDTVIILSFIRSLIFILHGLLLLVFSKLS